jgi:hypothetical protein
MKSTAFKKTVSIFSNSNKNKTSVTSTIEIKNVSVFDYIIHSSAHSSVCNVPCNGIPTRGGFESFGAASRVVSCRDVVEDCRIGVDEGV